MTTIVFLQDLASRPKFRTTRTEYPIDNSQGYGNNVHGISSQIPVDLQPDNNNQISVDLQSDKERNALSFAEALNEWKNEKVNSRVQQRASPTILLSPKNQSYVSVSGNTSSLLDGEYDEDKNALEFAQALREWRNAGSAGTGIRFFL